MILRVDDFLEFGIFIIKSLNLVEVLFFEVFNFGMEIVIELRLQAFDLLSVLGLFVSEIASKPLLFFPKFSNFEIGFLAEPDKLHIQVADFILFFLDKLFQFSDFQFIFFVVVQMISLQRLDFHMMLILYL